MPTTNDKSIITQPTAKRSIKCIVWDLDNTLWDGILLEDKHVALRPEILTILQTLDSRGILNSIASKNDQTMAQAKLEELGIWDYFLYPQIHWYAKSSSIKEIARLLNIGIETFAFIDDQAFERDEVSHTLHEVLCLDGDVLQDLLTRPELQPRFQTEDAKNRRKMYFSDMERNKAEHTFDGPAEEFLASLQMVLTIAEATEADLQRAEELTIRTHQLNTTGYTYSYEELDSFRQSDQYMLLVAELRDKYGSYGKIGLALLSCSPEGWVMKLLLMSCRVISRGIGSFFINYLISRAQQAQVRLQAEFVPNDRNRAMLVTYKFAGFKTVKQDEKCMLLEYSFSTYPTFPSYVELHAPGL